MFRQLDHRRAGAGEAGEGEAVGGADVREAPGPYAGVDSVHERAGRAEQEHRQVEKVAWHGGQFDTTVRLLDYMVKELD
ncbi:hypothetical protein Asp14428_69720 [Actinoplanes sp. NBRC 14428]|nr:hypothetical protein Asp14428_69720 [Actinoplanes sp. NBRC 14428]